MDKDEYRIAVKKLVGYVLRNDIPIRPKNFKQEHLNQILEVEFDGRRLDNLNWGVYRINDEGEVYPTPFVQCQTLGHALYRYATVYAKKAEAYAVAPPPNKSIRIIRIINNQLYTGVRSARDS